MSSFKRQSVLGFLLAAPLAACGFEPVYAPGTAGSELIGQVVVREPTSIDSYELVQNLEQRFGRSASPNYALSFALAIEDEGQAVTNTGEINRYRVQGIVDYALTPMETEDPIATGRVESFTGYSATGNTVETLAAERDAYRRLMAILADKILTELQATADLTP